MPVIGFLGVGSPGPFAPYVAAFHQGLNETGFVEGKDLAIEYRWADGHYDRLSALAADLVGRNVDVIATSAAGALAAKNATSTRSRSSAPSSIWSRLASSPVSRGRAATSLASVPLVAS